MTDMELLRLAQLERLFAAFNRHDGDGVMACMTDDVVFCTVAGADACGTRLTGAAQVRAAFEKTFSDMPDASWECTRHAVFGDRALSEWIFRATTAAGQRIEAEGCDIFRFSANGICEKSAFRKDRPLLAAEALTKAG